MNTEALIRQAIRNTINQVGCTGKAYVKWDFENNTTDAEVFENRVLLHFKNLSHKPATKPIVRLSDQTEISYKWTYLKTGNSGTVLRKLGEIPEYVVAPWNFKTTQDLIDFWNAKSSVWKYELLGTRYWS